MSKRIKVEPCPNVDLSGSRVPSNHEAGSGRPIPAEVMRDEFLQPATPILRRRRSARKIPVSARARRRGQDGFEGNLQARPETFLKAVEPFRKGLVVGVECMFAWYWLADLCEDQGIPFVLGHALYMKAIHGGKAKNDRIDAGKIAGLLRGVEPSPA